MRLLKLLLGSVGRDRRGGLGHHLLLVYAFASLPIFRNYEAGEKTPQGSDDENETLPARRDSRKAVDAATL
jgi:hypothetical protein